MKIKRGVLLAGGAGTRLKPFTQVSNKHLALVYNDLMINYPLKTLLSAGIENILIVTGKESGGDFLNFLGDGGKFNANFTYRVQEEPNGIAGALKLCKDFANNESIAVILGDNFFEKELLPNSIWEKGSKIFLKEVSDANRFGIAEIKDDKVIGIEEKPKDPKSNLAVTGFYIYDNQVWDVIDSLKPSARGELEISDVNQWYINKGEMKHEIVKGYWSDMGTHESLLKTSNFVRNNNK